MKYSFTLMRKICELQHCSLYHINNADGKPKTLFSEDWQFGEAGETLSRCHRIKQHFHKNGTAHH